MAKHRKFNADRFLDKFQGQEELLRAYVAQWNGHLPLSTATLNVPVLKEFLANGEGDGKDAMTEGLYRAYDLSTERGHEDLIAACRDCGRNPDPGGQLPVECLSLKVLTENEEAFTLAYARNTLWLAERFSIFRGKSAKDISDPGAVAVRFHEKLAETFMEDKDSDRVLVRQYREGPYVNFIVYHEKRTKAELVFTGEKAKRKVLPHIWRPVQQDFISYNHVTGQVEIEARFEKEEEALRKLFAECCLGDPDFFEGSDAANRINLAKIADDDFNMSVNDEHAAALIEIHFKLKQKHGPSFSIRSKNILETLDLNYLRKRLKGAMIQRAVFKIIFPDDERGKRVELAGTNKVSFKRATHAEEVFRYLRNWELILA